jgi:ubiquinone/menaquinone biosynthesis C-methylase UbiE
MCALLKGFWKKKEKIIPASEAYDLWADAYDQQPDNAVLAAEQLLFDSLMTHLSLPPGAVIGDVGCGTGRHWSVLYQLNPSRVLGFDVSAGMLKKLAEKFPDAELQQVSNWQLSNLPSHTCNLVVSTLALAHIHEGERALKEWNRVLKPGGWLLLTDYHPELLKKGGNRSFVADNQTHYIQNFIYPVDSIRMYASKINWIEKKFSEITIDEPLRQFYEKQDAIHLYEKFKGQPLLYGLLYQKKQG